MKKIKILLIILCVFFITSCKKDDSLLFKKEYESLNNDSSYRSVTIPNDNPMIYATDSLILEKISNKEDMVVYFGFNKCPWCRSVIENLIQVATDLKIDKVYYLDVLDIRDVKTIDNGNVLTTKEGSYAYNEIVKLLKDYLSDYEINGVSVGKRIYAPNILVIKNGEIIGIETGISDFQTEANIELTNEIKKDSYNKIYTLLSQYTKNTCSDKGC